MPTAIGITKGVTTWNAQQRTVERVTDNAAYTSAHPDDTLVLAGPPRKESAEPQNDLGWQSLLAIGMMQNFQVTSQKPTQPMAAIGSGRSYFVSGKSQTTWRIGRLFCNGRNLLRVLYHNAVAGGVKVNDFDDPAAREQYSNMFLNLDSELFYMPFGIAALFRDKAHDVLGGFYAELCMLNSYTVGFTAGQNMIMEDVGGMCDRLLPYHATTAMDSVKNDRVTLDTVIGFVHGPETALTTGAGIMDDNLSDATEWP